MSTRKVLFVVASVVASCVVPAAAASAAPSLPTLPSIGVGHVTIANFVAYGVTEFDGILAVGGQTYVGDFSIAPFFAVGAPPAVALTGNNPVGPSLSGVCRLVFTPDALDALVVMPATAQFTGWEVFRCVGRIGGGRAAAFAIHLDAVRVTAFADTVEEIGAYHVVPTV